MERSELIYILKDPATEVMLKKKICASILIAEAVNFLFSSKMYRLINSLIEINNPYGIEVDLSYKGEYYRDTTTGKCYQKYSSLETGISNFITIHEKERFNSLKGIYNWSIALQKDDTLSIEKFGQLYQIIDTYRLGKIDDSGFDKHYASKKNVVEIPTSNSNTLFYQKQCNCAPDKVKLTPRVLKEQLSREAQIQQKKKFEWGSKVAVKNANLYAEPDSKRPIRSVTGNYYIAYNKVNLNSRVGLVTLPGFADQPEMIFGYVDKTQIK